jgi:hypothetical protein
MNPDKQLQSRDFETHQELVNWVREHNIHREEILTIVFDLNQLSFTLFYYEII